MSEHPHKSEEPDRTKCYIIRIKGVEAAIADVAQVGEQHWVTRIQVPVLHRGKGYGRRLMKRILDDADKDGVVLHLGISPSPGGMSYAELKRWYKRCGFKGNTSIMRREPKGECHDA